jgi:hypothetical protein
VRSGADVLVDGIYLAVAIRAVVVPLIVRCCSRGKRPHIRVAVTRRVLEMPKLHVADERRQAREWGVRDSVGEDDVNLV